MERPGASSSARAAHRPGGPEQPWPACPSDKRSKANPLYRAGIAITGGKVTYNPHMVMEIAKMACMSDKPGRMDRAISFVCLAGFLGVAALGCQDTQAPFSPHVQDTLPTPPPPPHLLDAVIVSDPGEAVPSGVPSITRGFHSGGLVYVSLPPGSVPTGEVIRVFNRSGGDSLTAPMMAGGVDPLALPAVAGDTVDIRITTAGGTDTLEFISLVPLRKPPVVVRTDPPPAKRDVPLNTIIILIFSEPIKPMTLSATSVQLLLNGQPVAGTVAFTDTTQLAVSFTPDLPLLVNSVYSLVATSEITDLSGDPLETAVAVAFETQAGTGLASDAIAFSRDGHIFVINPDGSGLRQLTNDSLGQDDMPAWSPDGLRIAFTRFRPDRGYMMFGEAAIHVINADGTGLQRLSAVGDSIYDAEPSWSPDGSRIAFHGHRPTDYVLGSEIHVMNADGTNPVQLTAHHGISGQPAWSPDGSRIAYRALISAPIGNGIFVMQADGSNSAKIISGDDSLYSPSWSPDGSRVLTRVARCLQFSDLGNGLQCVAWEGPHLIAIDADGSNPVRLSDYVLSAYDHNWAPSEWSRDGLFIAFTQTPDAYPGPFTPGIEYVDILRLSDGQVRRLTEGSAPSWRP